MCVIAGAVGAVAGGVGSLVNATSGGGGGGGSAPPQGGNVQTVYNPQSLGQTMTGILSGGLSTALGISGLAGGNLNQLQAGAAAANPWGSQAPGYYGALSSLLGGGLQNQISGEQGQNQGYLGMLNSQNARALNSANLGQLGQLGNISTPGATSAMQGLVTNPQSASLPSSIQNILAQNPYAMNAGQQFQFQQGENALNATMAAQGFSGSAHQMLALQDYGQQAANTAMGTNIQAALGAEQAQQGAFGQQVGALGSLSNILSQQQQNSFGNQLGVQQFGAGLQQQAYGNQAGILNSMMQMNSTQSQLMEGLLPSLLTATQATTSSPSTAGGILANLGVANQGSAGNIGAGIGGLANGIGSLANGLSNMNWGGGGGSYSGAFNTGAGTTTYDPTGGGSSYTYSGDNSYGFTM